MTDSTAFRTLTESGSICRDCIVLKPVVVMGDTAGPGYVEWTESVTRDSLGNYWVGQRNAVKVFDPAGNFLRQVGRAGKGPMEFGWAEPIYTDGEGRVHIFDPDNLRETTVASDFALHAERRLPARVNSAVPIPGSGRYAVSMWLPTADYIGLPLHIVEGPEVLHSFGVPVGERVRPLKASSSRRWLATDHSGHIFSAYYFDYIIEAWTESGRRITGFEGPVLNETPRLPGAVSVENPPPNQIWAIHVNDLQQLWVVSSHRKDDWLDRTVEVVRPSGDVRLRPTHESPRSLHTGRLDVIDLNSGAIIASSDHDALITAFVGEGLGLEVQYTRRGIPQLVVWSIEFHNPDEG